MTSYLFFIKEVIKIIRLQLDNLNNLTIVFINLMSIPNLNDIDVPDLLNSLKMRGSYEQKLNGTIKSFGSNRKDNSKKENLYKVGVKIVYTDLHLELKYSTEELIYSIHQWVAKVFGRGSFTELRNSSILFKNCSLSYINIGRVFYSIKFENSVGNVRINQIIGDIEIEKCRLTLISDINLLQEDKGETTILTESTFYIQSNESDDALMKFKRYLGNHNLDVTDFSYKNSLYYYNLEKEFDTTKTKIKQCDDSMIDFIHIPTETIQQGMVGDLIERNYQGVYRIQKKMEHVEIKQIERYLNTNIPFKGYKIKRIETITGKM